MIAKERSPPKQKIIPSTNPELKTEWEELYNSLIRNGHNQTSALNIIANEYQVSRPTVIYNLPEIFPGYRRHKKNWAAKKWRMDKINPENRKKINPYKARYQSIRYHAAEHICSAFETVAQNPLSLYELSDLVKKEMNVGFKQQSLLNLSDRYQIKHGFPLLLQIHGYFETPKYILNPRYNGRS